MPSNIYQTDVIMDMAQSTVMENKNTGTHYNKQTIQHKNAHYKENHKKYRNKEIGKICDVNWRVSFW